MCGGTNELSVAASTTVQQLVNYPTDQPVDAAITWLTLHPWHSAVDCAWLAAVRSFSSLSWMACLFALPVNPTAQFTFFFTPLCLKSCLRSMVASYLPFISVLLFVRVVLCRWNFNELSTSLMPSSPHAPPLHPFACLYNVFLLFTLCRLSVRGSVELFPPTTRTCRLCGVSFPPTACEWLWQSFVASCYSCCQQATWQPKGSSTDCLPLAACRLFFQLSAFYCCTSLLLLLLEPVAQLSTTSALPLRWRSMRRCLAHPYFVIVHLPADTNSPQLAHTLAQAGREANNVSKNQMPPIEIH